MTRPKDGKKIIDGLKEALAWTEGEGTVAIIEIIDGQPVRRHLTFEEYQAERARDAIIPFPSPLSGEE